MPKSLKTFILWNHSRGTWQYDIFCLLIIAFIFLTPKVWFENRENLATQTSQVNVTAEDFSKHKNEMFGRFRELSENPDAKILDRREKKGENGEVVLEVKILR